MDSLCSVYSGEALDKHAEHIVPVQHVDPDAPRVSSEMLPAASHDLVAGEQLGAVLDAFLLTSQPRERYKQAKSKKNSEFQTCRAHLSLVAGIDLFELCSGKLTTVSC